MKEERGNQTWKEDRKHIERPRLGVCHGCSTWIYCARDMLAVPTLSQPQLYLLATPHVWYWSWVSENHISEAP